MRTISLTCVFLALATVALTGNTFAHPVTQVAGVPIYGSVDAVSVKDIRQVIAAYGSGTDKPAKLVVINKNSIRAYLKAKDMGWIPFVRTTIVEPNGDELPGWTSDSVDIGDNRQVLQFIGTVDEVYIFPVTTPLQPHLDNEHMRLLNAKQRQSLTAILSDYKNWCRCLYLLLAPPNPPTNVGFVFQKGNDTLVLFFDDFGSIEGTFNGENQGGMLAKDARIRMEEWKHRYAKTELSMKASSGSTGNP